MAPHNLNNPYKLANVDYKRLADEHPSLKRYLKTSKKGIWIDFKDPKAVREYNYALLWVDFRLRLEIPLDVLCPPIANRLEYVLWIEHLLGPDHRTKDVIRGVDIGTGASCIYPLLGVARNKHWRFHVLEVDERLAEYATENIRRNKMEDKIQVVLTDQGALNFAHPALLRDGRSVDVDFDFCMCNPPFFEDSVQRNDGLMKKADAPSTVCTGSDVEMIAPEGEVGFVKNIISQSIEAPSRFRWYTSLIGIKSHVSVLEAEIIRLKPKTILVHTFQISRTTRWILSWSFVV
ncbi:ribosomal RNA large subunit methyltransferase F-like protein [Cladochytrium replicatum]|nr:ribosomal RNA large subunit methyltransferase F-like protein [Cladochytrium replicatum]